jgi:hypothetical protein
MRSVLLVFLASTAPALADETMFFQSPTGNIQCAISTGDYSGVRCDILDYSPSFEQSSPDCEFDWGGSFGVDSEADTGYLLCVSDAVAGGEPETLAYGEAKQLGPYRCTSEKTGISCSNQSGHGFALSKAEQRLF